MVIAMWKAARWVSFRSKSFATVWIVKDDTVFSMSRTTYYKEECQFCVMWNTYKVMLCRDAVYIGTIDYINPFRSSDAYFLHAKPWIPGGEISIFTAVIHYWRSPLRQFARAMTIDKYDVTIPVFRVRMTSQINCGDVTMLGQKRPPLATMAKRALDDSSKRICVFMT